MPLRSPIFAVILLTFFVLLAALLASPGGAARGAIAGGLLFLGPRLLELRAPAGEGWRPLGALEVLVRFPNEGRVVPETFRCLLNGRDVTEQLTVGRNGVGGSVYPLHEGRNRLRVEVFGRSWWSSRFYQDGADRSFDVRAPLGLDRADLPLDSGSEVHRLAPRNS